MKLILASQSIGRKKLLEKLKVPFVVMVSSVDEDKIAGSSPIETLKLRAKLKGEDILKKITNNPITQSTNNPINKYSNKQINKSLTKPYTLVPSPYLILSADSGAILDDQLIGKPKTYSEAVNILKKLSNHTHEFVTALFIQRFQISPIRLISPISETISKSFVTFRKLTDEDIKLYLKVTEYNRFAGGYAISSAQNFITKIEGSISNVIGLPLEDVIPVISKFFLF